MRIATERRLPEAVAEDRNTRLAVVLFLFGERAAQERRGAQHVEKVAAHAEILKALRLAEAGQEHVGRAAAVVAELLVGGDAGEALVAPLPVGPVGGRRDVPRPAPKRIRLEDPDQFVGILVGQRPEQHRADDAEDRGAGADADGERGDRNRRERRVFAQRAESVADVLQRGLDERQAAVVAVRFLNLHRSSETQDGLAPRLIERQTAPDVIVGEHVEMCGHLVLELRVQGSRCEQPMDARERDVKPGQHVD